MSEQNLNLLQTRSQDSRDLPIQEWEYEGKLLIENMVARWAGKYKYLVSFNGFSFDQFFYTAEFSKPTSTKPVPEATVKIHFTISFGVVGTPTIEFTFENESLRHKPGQTVREAQMESWIDRVYQDKINIRKMMNLVTKFESTRLLLTGDENDEAFYEGCSLLESTLGEIFYDDELDDSTRDMLALLKKVNEEIYLPKGASQSKLRILRISNFDAIAQVLGKVEETATKQRGEKTNEQKLTEFFRLYPHFKDIEAKLGEFKFPPDKLYYLGRNEEAKVAKLPIDESFKRQRKEAQIFQELRDDGSMLEIIYKGEWNKKKGTKDGKGMFVWPEGVMYVGFVHDDKLNGFGRLVHRHGDVYEGDWFDNLAWGEGVFYHTNGVKYTGEWENDQPHGKGQEEWPDGNSYYGGYNSGARAGYGVFAFVNGNEYRGEWMGGLPCGFGTYKWSDGRVYEGEWSKGQLNGKGSFTWPDGRIYNGHYINDKKEGHGEYFWPDGRIYRGPWKEGKQHGEGYYTSAEGVTRRGMWKDGKRLKWFKE
jgi:hypothetical protein